MIRSRETERDEDICAAIQYLDPECGDKGFNSAVTMAVLLAALLVFTIWVVLQLHGL